MKVALIPLAVGVLTTWLLAKPLANLLNGLLVDSGITKDYASTFKILGEVVTTPMTLVALAVIALGVGAWFAREHLSGLSKALTGLKKVAIDSFGFEAINRGVVNGVQDTGEALRVTQTGLLNWNVFGILLALFLVLGFLVWGA